MKKSTDIKTISVLLVDDHDLIGIAIKQLFSKTHDVKLVAFSKSGKDALEKFEQVKPDITIIDVLLPDIDGIELTKTIISKYPKAKIILHSSLLNAETIVSGFDAGAMGYVPKNFKPKQILEAIHMVIEGEHYSRGLVADALIDSYLKGGSNGNNEKLTPREKEMLKAVAQGNSNQRIADDFEISVRTVEAHKSNIMKKLKLFSTAELVIYAIKHKVITI